MKVERELLRIPCPRCGETFTSVEEMTRHDIRCWGQDTAYYNLTAILGINEDFNRQVAESA